MGTFHVHTPAENARVLHQKEYAVTGDVIPTFLKEKKMWLQLILFVRQSYFRYNDKTYKIDDIDLNLNPLLEFERREGRISFVEYYKTVNTQKHTIGIHISLVHSSSLVSYVVSVKNYKIEIKDMQQPLLISMPSARDKRRGQTAPSLFKAELCVVTGVDEAMRTDFRFKKTLDQCSCRRSATRRTWALSSTNY